ncbi:MAG TPA: hypothetical protein VGK18_09470 [Propionicimonas sp.]|uniref:hypothetical protein n=1 Tax=Propionicimonas sp. TaxID=1955623 RepID=UPI002F4271C8
MSALLVDDLIVPLPVRPAATGWKHVEHVEPAARPRPHLVTTSAPVGARVSRQVAPLRLTDRGIAVVVVFFLALIATAAVVLVTSFLSVSNDPVPAPGAQPALVALQG